MTRTESRFNNVATGWAKQGVLCRWSVPDRSIAFWVAFALVMWYTAPEVIAAMVCCGIERVARWGVHIGLAKEWGCATGTSYILLALMCCSMEDISVRVNGHVILIDGY